MENAAEQVPELTLEDRLKAILYQFVMLYERWSEDRQAAIKQQADLADLIKQLSLQVKGLKSLAPELCQQTVATIRSAIKEASEGIAKDLSTAASVEVQKTTAALAKAVNSAEATLSEYQQTTVWQQVKVFAASVIASVMIALTVVWLMMPSPKLALTDQQMMVYQEGLTTDKFWDKLSKKEQHRLLKLAYPSASEDNSSNSKANNLT